MTDLTRQQSVRSPTVGHVRLVRQRTDCEPGKTLGGKSNTELAAENAATWSRVLGFCLVRAGLPTDYRFPRRPGGSAALARGAAFVICHTEFRIPCQRLAELAGIGHQAVGNWVGGRRGAEVACVVRSWRCKAPRVPASIELTTDAGRALAAAARRTGVQPEVLASAAILAACSK